MAARVTVPATGDLMVDLHLHGHDGGYRLTRLNCVPFADLEGDDASEGRGNLAWVGPYAFSAALIRASTDRSRTETGRGWPLRVNITVRMARPSRPPTASILMSSRTPGLRSTGCSTPTRSP